MTGIEAFQEDDRSGPTGRGGRSRSSGPSRFIRTAIILLLYSASILLTLESFTRFYLFGGDALSFSKINSVHHFGESGMVRASSHEELAWELKPNLDQRFKLAMVRTNDEGLRDGPIDPAKPPNIFRIAVIGDSFTFPSGVEIGDAYHSVLEDLFNSTGHGARYQFVNFGTPGYNLRQYAALLERRVPAYDPDLVLVGIVSNDDKIHPARIFTTPYEPKKKTNPFFHLFLVDWIEINKITRAIRGAGEEGEGKPVLTRPPSYGRIVRNLNRLRSWSETAGVPVALAYLSLDGAKRDLYREAASESGLPFVDTYPEFEGENRSRFVIFPTDHHPNAEANRIFAEAIRRFLQEEGLTPPATGSVVK